MLLVVAALKVVTRCPMAVRYQRVGFKPVRGGAGVNHSEWLRECGVWEAVVGWDALALGWPA